MYNASWPSRHSVDSTNYVSLPEVRSQGQGHGSMANDLLDRGKNKTNKKTKQNKKERENSNKAKQNKKFIKYIKILQEKMLEKVG